MVRLAEHQLRQSMKAIKSAKGLILKKINEGHDNEALENIYIDLQNIELFLGDAIGMIEEIDDHFIS